MLRRLGAHRVLMGVAGRSRTMATRKGLSLVPAGALSLERGAHLPVGLLPMTQVGVSWDRPRPNSASSSCLRCPPPNGATCGGGKWADAAAGVDEEDCDDDLGLGWLAASERSSTASACSTPASLPLGGGASKRGERRRLQKLMADFEEMGSSDELFVQFTAHVLRGLGARARAQLASRAPQ